MMPDQPTNPNEPNKSQVESELYSEVTVARTSKLATQSLAETMGLGTGASEAHESLKNEALPQSIGRYLVKKILGKGGYGCVYLAFDDELQRHVTVKVPDRNRVTIPEDVQIFLAEARTLAKLEHPNVVPVHDVGHEWVSEKDPKDPKRVGLFGYSFRDNFSEGIRPNVIGYDLPDLEYSFNGFRVVRSRPSKNATRTTNAP
jgi:Protein kinase domain